MSSKILHQCFPVGLYIPNKRFTLCPIPIRFTGGCQTERNREEKSGGETVDQSTNVSGPDGLIQKTYYFVLAKTCSIWFHIPLAFGVC